MNVSLEQILPLLCSFLATVAATAIVRALARHYGFVARPRADRWHKKPTALLGGIGMFVGVFGACVAFVPFTPHVQVILASSSILFAVGLIDDAVQLKPAQKLCGQIVGAALVILSGLMLQWTPFFWINGAITLVWLVGITNAINLLDNMDGLAAGVSAVSAFFMAICFALNGQQNQSEFLLLAVFTASLLGFLVFNFKPASIFMGDCGSMFLGLFLASSALVCQGNDWAAPSDLARIALPLFLLAIPICDTTLVTICRKWVGRPISQGGRDHSSHRLVARGLSERQAVCALYTLAIAAGMLGLAVRVAGYELSLLSIVAFTLALVGLGLYLARVRVYEKDVKRPVSNPPLVTNKDVQSPVSKTPLVANPAGE